ncbi:MAG: hypothetical protein JNK16_07270 [Phycisphaerales bacterium]|nr:hypothetical protein [Phycisphaerales bacterium]
MVRFGVIFGLIFQSLALVWCAGRMPDARRAMGAETCAAAPAAHDAVCCCEGDGESARTTTNVPVPAIATLPERCCQCPLTLSEPRVPAVPDRRPGAELTRIPIELESAFVLTWPPRAVRLCTSVPASIHPPDFVGRLACERFCRWTI